jgi:PAS domain S-box-containing protein
MDVMIKKGRLAQYTILAVIIALVIIFFTFYLELLASDNIEFSVSGLFRLIPQRPIFIIFLLTVIISILAIYFLVKTFTKESDRMQHLLEFEQTRIGQVESFVLHLIHDHLETEFHSAGESDTLGESLNNLRDTLKKNKEAGMELRKQEEQRSWIAEGLAHISEILRNYIHDLEQLSFQVIKDITKYVGAIQGGFYMLDANDVMNKYFNLTAFFAYDRKKFADQHVKWGDGLIGTCALEQKTVHLKNIPDSYISVTSGLGESNPGNLVIVPMLYEDQIYGVLEFASFRAFEPNDIALIEKAAESIAATLSAGRISLNTTRLLEESKAQTQALTSHEEEMRQNMEELQATQEEASRQTERLINLEDTINQNLIRAEFTPEGKLISANNLFFEKFEFSRDLGSEGKQITESINADERETFREIWKKLTKNSEPYRGYIRHITRTGKDLWVIAALNITKNSESSASKVIYLALDASEEKMQMQKQERIVETVTNLNIKLEIDINGNVLDGNDNFIQLFGFTKKEIKSLAIFDLIYPIELEGFNKHWDGVIKGIDYNSVIRCKTTGDLEIWLKGAFNAVYNAAHDIERIVFIGHDITHERKMEAEVKALNETLKKQDKMLKEAEKNLISKLRDTKDELLSNFKETERIKNINEYILEELPDAVVTTSHDNRIVSFNKAAEKLWKIERKDVLNHDVNILFPEKLTEKDELIGSFTRPGDQKKTGQRRRSVIIDKNGKEISVYILLAKARVENQNTYMAFIQSSP